MNSIKLEDLEKFWELWKNHRAKMSVHFNVHMSKIMHTLIKVGVRTWEISCLVHILILRYGILNNSMLLGVNDIFDGICNLRFRILGGNCNFYPEATWKRGFIKSFSRIHLRRRFVWPIWGYHPAHDRVGMFVSAILYLVLYRLFVYFLSFENITATYRHTRNNYFHV